MNQDALPLRMQTFAEVEQRFHIRPGFAEVEEFAVQHDAQPPATESASGGYFLLVHDDLDWRIERRYFARRVIKLLDEHGVQNFPHIQLHFDPSYEELAVHRLGVWRAGKFIDQNQPIRFQLLRREPNLERFIFDGRYTASVALDDVRVGDILDYAYSITGENPVFEGRSSQTFTLQWDTPVRELQCRVRTNPSVTLASRVVESAAQPQTSATEESITHVLRMTEIAPRHLEPGCPDWAEPWPRWELSYFQSWKEVAAWAVNEYEVQEGEVAEVAMIAREVAASESSQTEQCRKLTEFVQNQIRYTGISAGPFSHRPHPPKVVLERRYGDCKDKSCLLVALLRALQIPAHPVLVNTHLTQNLPQCLPSPHAFDHVVVSAPNIQAKLLDATISSQCGPLAERWVPDYRWGLALRAGTDALTEFPHNPTPCRVRREERLVVTKYASPIELVTNIDYENWEADRVRSVVRGLNTERLGRIDADFYTSLYGRLEATASLEVRDDKERNVLSETSRYRLFDYTTNPELKKEYVFDVTGYTVLHRLPSIDSATRRLPLLTPFPLQVEHHAEILLPEKLPVKTETLKIRGKSFTFTRSIRRVRKTVHLTFSFECTAPFVAATDYADERKKLEDAHRLCNFRFTRPRSEWEALLSWLAIIGFIVGLLLIDFLR